MFSVGGGIVSEHHARAEETLALSSVSCARMVLVSFVSMYPGLTVGNEIRNPRGERAGMTSPEAVDAHALFGPLDRETGGHVLHRCGRGGSASAPQRAARHSPALAALYGVCGWGMLTIWMGQAHRPQRLRSRAHQQLPTFALILATRTMLPPPCGIMLRAASRAVKNAPCTLMSYSRFIRSNG